MKRLGTKQPPIPPAKARYILDINNLSQVDIAREIGNMTPGAVSRFINGQAYSQRFWDYFFKRFPEAKAA